MNNSELNSIIEEWVGINSSVVPLHKSCRNEIFIVTGETGEFILKVIKDSSMDVSTEQNVISHIPLDVNVRRILNYKNIEDDISIVLYPYIHGQTIDNIELNNINDDQLVIWKNDLIKMLDAFTNIPVDKVGVLNNNLIGSHNSWYEFISHYINSQIIKGPLASNIYGSRIRKVVKKNKRVFLDAGVKLCPMDLNQRNFLINEDKHLIMLHTPVLWVCDPQAIIGELSVHLTNTRLLEMLINHYNVPETNRYLYEALMAFTILVYQERFSINPIHEALVWGSDVTLFSLLEEALQNCE